MALPHLEGRPRARGASRRRRATRGSGAAPCARVRGRGDRGRPRRARAPRGSTPPLRRPSRRRGGRARPPPPPTDRDPDRHHDGTRVNPAAAISASDSEASRVPPAAAGDAANRRPRRALGDPDEPGRRHGATGGRFHHRLSPPHLQRRGVERAGRRRRCLHEGPARASSASARRWWPHVGTSSFRHPHAQGPPAVSARGRPGSPDPHRQRPSRGERARQVGRVLEQLDDPADDVDRGAVGGHRFEGYALVPTTCPACPTAQPERPSSTAPTASPSP